MKANELRIGNWIRYGSKIGEVYFIDKNGEDPLCMILSGSDFIDRELTNFDTIPLTEEWLIKFEFKKFLKTWYIHLFEIVKEDTEFRLYNYGLSPRIKYVHQLQNLYDALTGEELKIKENEPKDH